MSTAGQAAVLARVSRVDPLSKLEDANRLLAEVRDASDAKTLMDKASAAKHYARKQKLGHEAIQYAHRIEIDAGAMLGKFLKEGPKAKGTKGQLKGKASGGTPVVLPEKPEIITGVLTLADLGLTKKESAAAQKLAELKEEEPEQFAAVRDGKKSKKQAEKETKKKKKKEAKAAVPVDLPSVTDRFKLFCADIATVNGQVPAGSNDWIITDPPYPKEFLPVYDALGSFAARTLKPGGSLLVMVGQSYLPEIVASLSKHLKYQWMLAYLTPGGQAVQLWDRKVNTFWKPLLWFVNGEYKGDWIGDVCKSDANDNDKDHHHWGQSESGMADIVDRFTYPGQTVCDPFVGGGTTGVVAVKTNRLFVGIDKSADAIETTKRRLAEVVA